MMKGLEFLSYEERLRDPGMFSLEEIAPGRPYGNFQYLKGSYRKAGEGLFFRKCYDRTKRNGLKLKEGRIRLNIKKKFFTVRVERSWNSLFQ